MLEVIESKNLGLVVRNLLYSHKGFELKVVDSSLCQCQINLREFAKRNTSRDWLQVHPSDFQFGSMGDLLDQSL